jgi:multidrug efflux system outer membrane protein
VSAIFKHGIALSLIGLSLAGCTNLADDHERPALSASPAFDPGYRPDGTVTGTSISWQQFLPDPRLEVLVATALANNRDLVAATARIEQARARFRIEDARRLPTVVASGGATRTRTSVPATSIVTPGLALPGSITADRFDVGVGVTSFELDFWGRIANLSEAARAEYLATVSAQRAFYLSLIGDVAGTYFQLVETQEQIALAEATIQSRREALRIAKLRLESGVTSALPFRQSESLFAQAEQQLAVQKLTKARLNNSLSVLVGGRIPEPLPEGRSLVQQGNGLRLDAGLPSDLLLNRPDIVAAEERLRASRANIGAARAAFFPTISLTGRAGLTSDDLSRLFGSDGFSWSFGPSISLPIFDSGARRASLSLAEAVADENVARYDLTVQNAFREVSDALAGRVWLAEQIGAQERGIEAARKIARIALLRYSEGVADYLEVLDAERNLFAAQQQLLATRRAYLANAVTLYISLGGGQKPQQAEVLQRERQAEAE